MTQVYKRNFMRPHTDAPWYIPRDEFTAWVKEKYIDTGKCSKWREMSYDDSSELTMTLESVWDDSITVEEVTSQPMWVESTESEIQHNTDWGIILVSQGME